MNVRLQEITRRNRGVWSASRYEAFGWYLRGWCKHFSLVEIKTFYVNLDKWVRHRDPSMLLEAMVRARNLKKLGLSREDAVNGLLGSNPQPSTWACPDGGNNWQLPRLESFAGSPPSSSRWKHRLAIGDVGSHRVETDGERNGRAALVTVNYRPAGINPTVTFVSLATRTLHTKICPDK